MLNYQIGSLFSFQERKREYVLTTTSGLSVVDGNTEVLKRTGIKSEGARKCEGQEGKKG